MTEKLPARLQETGTRQEVRVFEAIDRDIARSLSEEIAQDNRLGFARSFTHRAATACWARTTMLVPMPALPDGMDCIPLTSEGMRVADQFGAAIADREPAVAAQLLGTLYITALPETFRASHGIFYTPRELVEHLVQMVEDAGVDWSRARVLDPACGGGAFLLPLARRMVDALRGTDPAFVLQQLGKRLRGVDIDPFGAWLAQSCLELALKDVVNSAGRPLPQMVEVHDSLELRPKDCGGFDVVIGNPPYGRVTLSAQRRSLYARSVYGHANLYGVFTDAALHWAKKKGIIAYVTPTSMLSGLYYKALRKLLASHAPPLAVNFVSDRADVFTDVLQETMLATYQRGSKRRTASVGFIKVADGSSAVRKAGAFALPEATDTPWLLPRNAEQAR